MKIYGANIHAWPLAGNPYHGKIVGAAINYYALAEDPQGFADHVAEFLDRELWKLDKTEIGGVISGELLAQNGKGHILAALETRGEFAIIHGGQFSSN